MVVEPSLEHLHNNSCLLIAGQFINDKGNRRSGSRKSHMGQSLAGGAGVAPKEKLGGRSEVKSRRACCREIVHYLPAGFEAALCSPSFMDWIPSDDRRYFGPSGFFATDFGFRACLLLRCCPFAIIGSCSVVD